MAKKAAAAPQQAAYVMPDVEVGDSVLWHDDLGAPPTAMALVTQVGTEAVTLAVLGEGYQNFIVKTGVRHTHHPNKEAIRATESGVWSHRPVWLALLARVAEMSAQVEDLRAALGVDLSKAGHEPPALTP